MDGGSALVQTLMEWGVDTAFSVPGESYLPILHAIQNASNRIDLITPRHESGVTFAAEAYGKLTGRPAAGFVSRGPGATNASIGVHTAAQDSTPMLLFIGHVPTSTKGREAFQEIDYHQMFGPHRQSCSGTGKFSRRCERDGPRRPAQHIRQARPCHRRHAQGHH